MKGGKEVFSAGPCAALVLEALRCHVLLTFYCKFLDQKTKINNGY